MTVETIPEDFFCSHLAQSCGEQIAGTAAASTTVWLALEVPRPWGAKALPESNLPAPVKERLDRWQQTVPGARLQFIKRESGFVTDGVLFFVGLAGEEAPVLYRFQLDGYEDLLNFDLASVVARHPRHEHHRHDAPLFLVCTNGKRDRCCAKWGLPIYRAMVDYAGEQVWQTTHTGGHRFAATLVCLPEGICYGWIDSEDVVPLIEAHRRRRLYRVDRYRGRACYNRVVQAAEALLREQTGVMDLAAYRLHKQEQITESHWRVTFVCLDSSTQHSLNVEVAPSAFANPLSCGKTEGETVPQVHLHNYQAH